MASGRALALAVLAVALSGCARDCGAAQELARPARADAAAKSERPRPPPDIPESGPLAQKVLYQQAKGLLNAGRTQQAEALFRRAIAAHPEGLMLANSYLGLGSALGDLGRHPDAVAAYEQVVKLRPGDPEARRALAVGLEDSGRLEEAQQALKQALVLDPALLAVYQDLAALQVKAGDAAAARETYAQYEKQRLAQLATVARNEDAERVVDALSRLSEARDPQTARWLGEQLQRSGLAREVRLVLVGALVAQGLEDGVDPLRKRLAVTADDEEREAIRQALGVLGVPGEPGPGDREPADR